jgi:hypothetical protein
MNVKCLTRGAMKSENHRSLVLLALIDFFV